MVVRKEKWSPSSDSSEKVDASTKNVSGGSAQDVENAPKVLWVCVWFLITLSEELKGEIMQTFGSRSLRP